jgi:hypothetical protein
MILLGIYLNTLLALFFWIPVIIHAILIKHNNIDDKRVDIIVKAIKSGS